MTARFISIEGLDGAGKTTHIDFIQRWFAARELPFVLTREPGGTPLGEELRSLLLQRDMHAETELLLMFAARREHVAQVIEPALGAGKWVLSDRFTDASYAYQGGGRGLNWERIELLERLLPASARPALTLFLDVPLEVSQQRLQQSRAMDRFEHEAASFHERVRQAYLRRIASDPQRFRVLDAHRGIAAIQADIAAILQQVVV